MTITVREILYTYNAKMIRVIDGDTIDAEIDLGFNVIIRQRIRLFGIDTPDSRSRDLDEKERGLAAKQRLISLTPKEFTVETILNKRGKFGRVMGIIHAVDENGELININETLVEEGFAVHHHGMSRDS